MCVEDGELRSVYMMQHTVNALQPRCPGYNLNNDPDTNTVNTETPLDINDCKDPHQRPGRRVKAE